MLYQIFNLGSILLGQTVARSVGNVDDGSASLDDSLNHTCQILVVGTSGILGIELYVLYISLGIGHGMNGTLYYLLTV